MYVEKKVEFLHEGFLSRLNELVSSQVVIGVNNSGNSSGSMSKLNTAYDDGNCESKTQFIIPLRF